jgi:hypothetical protein
MPIWVLPKHADANDRLGVKTRIFHLGDYRRATIPFGEDMPDDYFYVNGVYGIPAYSGGTDIF